MQTIPLVSICCIAYNQEKYIGQAIESFLMQRTDFPFEIIVHDDASTDRTAEIIREYAVLYPEIVKPIFQSSNQYSIYGLSFQYKWVFPQVLGKYIAFCEGDDYWIDPFKLRKQIDYMELNNDCGLVHTRAVKYLEKEGIFGKIIGSDPLNFESLVNENTISNLTVCLRCDLFREYIREVQPEQQLQWTTCDYPIWLWMIQKTRFKFIDEITGVYRILNKSICHHSDDRKRLDFHLGVLNILEYFLNNYGSRILTKKIRAKYTANLISMYFLNRRWDDILQSVRIFYLANDWVNLIWVAITLPFYPSSFFCKASYFSRNKLIGMFRSNSCKQ